MAEPDKNQEQPNDNWGQSFRWHEAERLGSSLTALEIERPGWVVDISRRWHDDDFHC
jgi:hypothetical protein